MAKLNIQRSIVINKKPEEVFKVINNFDTWTTWSPWLIMEEGVKVTVADNKKSYEWEGDITGAGNMKIASEKENESIDIDLQFLKPWKSKAKVGFDIKPEGDGTKVSWTMDSSLPFFLFWMKKQTEAYIGNDYHRGLELLKDYCEDGEVHSKLQFKENNKIEGSKYIGIKTSCGVGQMGENMERDFTKLLELVGGPQGAANPPFSQYHKWDMVNQQAEYTACVPVNEIPADLPAGVITGEVPSTDVFTVHHHGSYRHIGNAWSAGYARQQAKKFKWNKSIDPIEVYLNSPMDTAENELQTEIHFPVK